MEVGSAEGHADHSGEQSGGLLRRLSRSRERVAILERRLLEIKMKLHIPPAA
jgi:hypothetical protein